MNVNLLSPWSLQHALFQSFPTRHFYNIRFTYFRFVMNVCFRICFWSWMIVKIKSNSKSKCMFLWRQVYFSWLSLLQRNFLEQGSRRGKRLKLSSKRTRVPKKMTRMLAPFVERMNTSIDGKQSNSFQEISIGICITLSKQGVVLSMGQSYAENVFRHQYHLVN